MRKKYFILSVCTFLMILATIGQESFFKTYETPYTLNYNSIIESPKGEFFVTLNETDKTTDERQGSIYKFSPEGKLQNFSYFSSQNGGVINYIVQSETEDDQYVVGGCLDSINMDTTFKSPFIRIIDDNLETVYQYSYEPRPEDYYQILKVLMPSDSIIFCLVEISSTNTKIFYVDKINILRNLKTRYQINFVNDWAYPFGLMYNKNEDQLSVFFSGNAELKNSTYNHILKLSHDMELLAYDTLFNYLSFYTNGEFISDSTYILASNGHSVYHTPSLEVKYSMYAFKIITVR